MKRLMTAVFLAAACMLVILPVKLSTQTDPALVGQSPALFSGRMSACMSIC
jgi:hypothetical protein